ncbi:hypothetical protein ACFE04_002938 [Oxalis oulophora]
MATREINLFGKYDVGKLLGCGAFAKVYHARNVETGHNVAIKAVSKQKVAKSGLAVHVKREVSIMHRLRHPNIVQLHEVLATKTQIYFVMEFAKGGELFAKVAKGRFGENLSRRYFRQLISAVGYCHARGVFHRDLKPENLLLDENWDLKVSDFGLSARVKDQARPDALLHTLCGTPAYVAPEILGKKGYHGAKSDIWSCGVILFVLNAGYLPFNEANLMMMYRKIYNGEFRCPKWTSPELKHLLHRLLDTNPNTRITIDEIINDPWFNTGAGHDSKFKFHEESDFDIKESDHAQYSSAKKSLNAFDIISFSSGFNLTGLFSDTEPTITCERFVSSEKPETIINKVKQVAELETNIVKVLETKEWKVKLGGQDGNLIIVVVEVHKLTEEIVVVEIKTREGGLISDGIWKDKLRPYLSGLVHN